jgi:hypothetical protein
MTEQFEPTGAQARWDATFSKLDRSCPARRADESEMNYLRRLSRVGRKYIPKGEQIAQVQFDHTLPDDVIPRYAELMRECVERNLRRTDNMQPGDMRSVMVTDENTGAKIREWVGPESFVKSMGRPCRRVIAINAPAPSRLYAAADAGARLARGW